MGQPLIMTVFCCACIFSACRVSFNLNWTLSEVIQPKPKVSPEWIYAISLGHLSGRYTIFAFGLRKTLEYAVRR
jgi:hypothetical protein